MTRRIFSKTGLPRARAFAAGAGIILGLGALLLAYAPVAAQGSRTIWTGVYTVDQAARGRAAYDNHCSACHQEELKGREGPSLAGQSFMRKWEGRTLGRLFDFIQSQMPEETPETTRDEDKLDIIAYILQANRFPAGTEELDLDHDTWRGVKIEAAGGSGPAPTGAIVQVVGCLAAAADNGWILTKSSEPLPTTLEGAAREPQGQNASSGTLTFRLFSMNPSPEAHKGHTMRVKGWLIGGPSDDRINVLSLEMVSADCVS